MAVAYGPSEIVTTSVQNQRLSDEEEYEGLLLAAMASQHKAFNLLKNEIEAWEITEPMLFYALRNSGKE